MNMYVMHQINVIKILKIEIRKKIIIIFFRLSNMRGPCKVHIRATSQHVDKRPSGGTSLWAPDERYRGIARRRVEQLNRRGAIRFTRKLTPAAHCGSATIPDIEWRGIVLYGLRHIGNQWSRLCYTAVNPPSNFASRHDGFPKGREDSWRLRKKRKINITPASCCISQSSRLVNQRQRRRLNPREMKFPSL